MLYLLCHAFEGASGDGTSGSSAVPPVGFTPNDLMNSAAYLSTVAAAATSGSTTVTNADENPDLPPAVIPPHQVRRREVCISACEVANNLTQSLLKELIVIAYSFRWF